MTIGRFRQQLAVEGQGGGAAPRDFGREAAIARAQAQSAELRRIRRELDCEPPWEIGEIHVSGHQDRYDVWVFEQAGYWPCPSCSRQIAGRHHTPPQVYRCLTCDTETYVYVKIPIVECPDHGSQRVAVPWSGHQDKWSYSGTVVHTEHGSPADTGAGGR
jgi:hypothetical protein